MENPKVEKNHETIARLKNFTINDNMTWNMLQLYL
jgi:hypothetical protein